MAADRNSTTPAVVVSQVDQIDGEPCTPWVAFALGSVELDLSADGTGCIAMLDTTITFNSLAGLDQIRALAVLLNSTEVQAALHDLEPDGADDLTRWLAQQLDGTI